MEPTDFLEVSYLLLNSEKEVQHRNAASQAYYCAFHVCKQFLQNLPNHMKMHIHILSDEVLKNLLSSSDKRLKSVGHKLNQVKWLRYRADYDLNHVFTLDDAKRQLVLVDKILSEIRTLSQPSI